METRLTQLAVGEFVERLATDAPVPGGGSAAALAGAMAGALVQMVVALTTGRPGAEEHEDALREISVAAAGVQSDLLRLAEVDAAAYGAVVAARRLPRDTERDREARRVQIEAATREATRAPLETARRAADGLALAERVAPIGSPRAISDVGVAGLLAVAAIRGAAQNVEINLPHLSDDEPLRDEAREELRRLLDGLDGRESELRATVAERLA